MFDETDCGGDGGHTFCCPAGSSKMPTCGWYGHNNGRCPTRSECPSDMTEIASNEIYCKKQKGSKKQNFQTACCKTDVVGTKVYGTCEWGQYPKCDAQEGCPNPLGNKKMGSLLAYSASGSGGGNCDDAKNELGLNVPGVQYRKFCCNDSDKNLRFTDCKKFRDVGPVPDIMPSGFCRSGCPPDRIQVAIDTQVDTCAIAKVGGMAHCCKTDYAEIVEWENPKIDAFENDVKAWIKKPTCTNKKLFLSRRTLLLDEVVSNSSLSTDLISRADKDDAQLAFNIQLARMIAATLAKPLLETLVEKWNNAVKDNYPWLVMRYLRELKAQDPKWETEDPEIMADYVLCDPESMNRRIASIHGKTPDGHDMPTNCSIPLCDSDGNCDEDSVPEVFRRYHGRPSSHTGHTAAHHLHRLYARITKPEEKKFVFFDDDGDELSWEYLIQANDPPDKLDHDDHKWMAAIFLDESDCHNIRLDTRRHYIGMPNVQTEHPFDKSMRKRFMDAAVAGTLESGATPQYGNIPLHFFEEIIRLGEDYGGYDEIPGNPGFTDGNLWNRLYEALGSQTNFANFVITHVDLNNVKGRLMTLSDVASLKKEKIEDRLKTKKGTDRLLKLIRATIALPEYMGLEDGVRDDMEEGPNTKTKLNNIINDIVRQLMNAEILYERHFNQKVTIAQFFVEWLKDFYSQVDEKATEWLTDVLVVIKDWYKDDKSFYGEWVRKMVSEFREDMRLASFQIPTDWDIPLLEDDPMDEDEG